jgi:hypothetical protein
MRTVATAMHRGRRGTAPAWLSRLGLVACYGLDVYLGSFAQLFAVPSGAFADGLGGRLRDLFSDLFCRARSPPGPPRSRVS